MAGHEEGGSGPDLSHSGVHAEGGSGGKDSYELGRPDPEYEAPLASFAHAMVAPSNRQFRKELVDVVGRAAYSRDPAGGASTWWRSPGSGVEAGPWQPCLDSHCA